MKVALVVEHADILDQIEHVARGLVCAHRSRKDLRKDLTSRDLS